MQGKRSQAETAWRGRMARYRGGSLTVAEFCRRERVSVPSFYHWRKRLGPTVAPKPPRPRSRGRWPSIRASNLFVPVNVTCSPVAEIEFPNGVRVRVPATNAEAIRAAVLAGGDPFGEDSSC